MTSSVVANSSPSFMDDDSSPARIIRAAVSAIATHGIDHVTASQLINGAHVARSTMSVSYTHLTLPTIYSV